MGRPPLDSSFISMVDVWIPKEEADEAMLGCCKFVINNHTLYESHFFPQQDRCSSESQQSLRQWI